MISLSLVNLCIALVLMLLIIIAVLIWLNIKKKSPIISPKSSEELVCCLHTLDHVVESYIQQVFIIRLNLLKSKYNLDPKSRVNSIKLYQKEFKNLLKSSSLEIVNYISKDVYDSLLKYYSEDGLFLIIISKLQSVSK